MNPTGRDSEGRARWMKITAFFCFAFATSLFCHWVERELDLERTEDVAIGLLVVAGVLAGLALVLMVLASGPFRRMWDGLHPPPPDNDSSDEFGDDPLEDSERGGGCG